MKQSKISLEAGKISRLFYLRYNSVDWMERMGETGMKKQYRETIAGLNRLVEQGLSLESATHFLITE